MSARTMKLEQQADQLLMEALEKEGIEHGYAVDWITFPNFIVQAQFDSLSETMMYAANGNNIRWRTEGIKDTVKKIKETLADAE